MPTLKLEIVRLHGPSAPPVLETYRASVRRALLADIGQFVGGNNVRKVVVLVQTTTSGAVRNWRTVLACVVVRHTFTARTHRCTYCCTHCCTLTRSR